MNRLLKHLAATAMFAVSSAAMAASGDGQGSGQAAASEKVPILQYLQKGEARITDPAPGWDYLWKEVLIDITVIGILFALMTAFFIWRYRRVPGGSQVGSGPKLSPAAAIGWAVIPAFVFLAADFFLDLLEGHREGRLADMTLLGCPPEMLLARQHDDITKLG